MKSFPFQPLFLNKEGFLLLPRFSRTTLSAFLPRKPRILKAIASTLIIAFLSLPLISQEAYSPLEWGKTPASDLNMVVYEPDSTAQAVVLNDEGYMRVARAEDNSYEWHLRRHRRVKILHDAAISDHGNVVVYYYHKDRTDQLLHIKAQTIAPDGTTTEVDPKEIFREKLNEYWSKATFGFPNVVVGSVLEYRYDHYSKRITVPDEWAFRENIPVRSSYFEFVCDVPITYTYLLKGAEFMPAENLPDNRQVLRLGKMKIQIDGAKFWMQNGAAVIPEPYMTTEEDYFIKVRFQASEVHYANGFSNSIFGSWEETAKELLDHQDLGVAFSKKRNYRKLLEAALLEISPGEDEAETVYQISQFVSREIKWSGRRGIRTDISLDEAFERHEADLAEIQYAGLALLREMDIEAYPVILSTRDNGAMITAFPFLDQFNYVVLLVKANGHLQLLDLSDPLLKPGSISIQALNGKGFLLREQEPGWIDLELPVSQNILAWNNEITAEGAIQGEMKCTLATFSARNDRAEMQTKSLEEIWAERLPAGNKTSDFVATNFDDVRQPLVIKGTYEIPEAGFINAAFLYFSPCIYSNFSENPFQAEERDYPIDFPYPFEEKSVYSYTIPEGFIVESLPENMKTTLPDDDASFHYMIQERNSKVSIIISLQVKKTLFLPNEYPALRSLFEEAVQKMQEQIVLKKI